MKTIKIKTNCWVWPYSINASGYGHIGKGKKVFQAHRFLYEIVVGKVPHSCELDHTCRNKKCVNPTHLEPVSHAENCRRSKQTKLKKEDVKWIRKMAGKMTHKSMAEKLGISRQSVSYILQGRRWI